MSENVEDWWERLLDGVSDAPADPRMMGALRQRVVDAQRSGSLSDREEALSVSVALWSSGGRDWVARFATDADSSLRRRAVEAAQARGEDGGSALRAFVADADPALSVYVIGQLTLRGDKAATPRVRMLLSSPHATVRAAAAHMLGFVAGPVVRPQLSPIAESDPDRSVRAAALEALERIGGLRPREPRTQFEPSAVPEAPVPDAAAEPGPLPEPAPVVDEAPAPVDVLATSTSVDALIEALDAVRDAGETRAAQAVRRKLSHTDAAVRSHALGALGALGGPATLPAIGALLRDGDADVRSAAIDALVAAATRTGAESMAIASLTATAHGTDAALASAAKDAIETLRGA